MQKTNVSQLSSKNVGKNFTAFNLIDNDVLQSGPVKVNKVNFFQGFRISSNVYQHWFRVLWSWSR